MAIVRSLGVGEGKKSAGMLTYRSVRGRTIASRRVISNASNTPSQASQRSVFGNAAKFMMFILNYVEDAFEKSKFGSSRNNYLKSNPHLSAWGGQQLLGEVSEGAVSVGDALAVSNMQLKGGASAGINFVSRGSAGGVQVIPGKLYSAEAPWGADDTMGVCQIYDAVTFNFALGAVPADVDVAIYKFPKAPTAAASITRFNMSDKNIETHKQKFGMYVTTNADGLIESLNFDMKQVFIDEGEDDAVIIPVVRYRKKVVSNNVFTATSGREVLP